MTNVNKIIEEIRELSTINQSKSFEYAQKCSKLLRNQKEEDGARRIIINILDNWEKLDNSTHELWSDLIESAGFYPYLDKENNKLIFKNTAGEIRKGVHKSENLEKYFHEEQKRLSEILNSEKNLIVSAPTSFGKSLLIEEIVAGKKYKNIVVIQPTLALLDETRKKLIKYRDYYKIIVRTSQEPSKEKGNLFLLTAERIMEYQGLPQIDFFVIDEFYKLDADRDERSHILNSAFNLLINKHKSKFYLLGPNIDKISEGFAQKYNAEFYQTKYSLVDNQVFDVYSRYKNDFGMKGKKKIFKEKKLFEWLLKLKDEQTIIYCSSPPKVRYLSKKFQNYLVEHNKKPQSEELSIIEWIKKNVSEKWNIIDCLNYGIGIHDGALQKHITSTIIKYFNENRLKYLFCTSTIIEGVNTSAKNIIFFDNKKGPDKVDFFDYSNIKGRSGRMMVHYVGRIFNFNEPPEKKDVIVNISFFEQNPISDEVLIQLDKKDVKNKDSGQYKQLEQIPKDEKEIFKRNGVSVKGQKEILKYLKENIHNCYYLLNWTSPKKNQLEFALDLCWKHLKNPNESLSIYTSKQLCNRVISYQINKNIMKLVHETENYYTQIRNNPTEDWHRKYAGMSDEEIHNEAIRDTFQVLKHWFHYKVPKWLNVMNELQKYICEKNKLKPGNYRFYASQIENDFVRENLSILLEYGIPKSAINKLEKYLPPDLNEDLVLNEINTKQLIKKVGLIEYEKEKIIENL